MQGEKRGISADMAMKLSKALGGSPQFWLNLQNSWELSQLEVTTIQDIQPIAAQVH
jgi:addiction module HigA family antidote